MSSCCPPMCYIIDGDLQRSRSPTPVKGEDGGGKTKLCRKRRRLVLADTHDEGLDEQDQEEPPPMKKKIKKIKVVTADKQKSAARVEKLSPAKPSKNTSTNEQQEIEEEMWDFVTGDDPEMKKRKNEDLDDEGDDEIEGYFKFLKKKKKVEKSPEEISMMVEKTIAMLEVAAEEDVELNRQRKPAIKKLKMIPLLTEALSKKQLQREFLDHGVLAVLQTWLQPLPDGSLPNVSIRSAVLELVLDLPMELERQDRIEQLKLSGFGKAVMFMSRSHEETAANRKLANRLVYQWSRVIYNNTSRYDHHHPQEEEDYDRRRRLQQKKQSAATTISVVEYEDFDILDRAAARSSGRDSVVSRPEPSSLDFVVRPPSRVDPAEVEAKKREEDRCRMNLIKKIRKMRARNKKQMRLL